MRLTRSHLLADLRTLEAQLRAAEATATTALAEVARLSDPDGSRLIRALHHLDKAEADIERMQEELDGLYARFADAVDPHAFPKGDA